METILDLIKRYKYWIGCTVLAIILLFIGFIYFINNNSEQIEDVNINLVEETVGYEDNSLEEIKETIIVDIKGEVNNPGVYELPIESRVIDAIDASGGLTNNSDTTNINLSKKLSDENVIIVSSKETKEIVKYIEKECNCPTISDVCINNEDIVNYKESDDISNNSSKISINKATKEELMILNGIGESKANDIINYRNENGLFQSIEDIKNVSGIGDKMFEKIKDQITV